MMNSFTRFFKDKVLWILIGFWIISQVIITFLDIEDTNGIFQSFMSASPVLMLAIGCLIAPVLEEFSFRGWVFKSLAGKIITFVLFSFFMIATFSYYGIICIAIIFYPWFLEKNEKRRKIILLILSSIFFALAHYGNWDSLRNFFISFPCYLSIGLLLGYLAYKTGKLWLSILVHVLNNSIAFALMIFQSPIPGDHFHWVENNMDIRISKVSIFDRDNSNTLIYTLYPDIEYPRTTIPNLIVDILSNNPNTIVKEIPTVMAYYNVKVSSTDSLPVNLDDLCRILIDSFNIKISSEMVEKPLYGVEIKDIAKFNSDKDSIAQYRYSFPLLSLSQTFARHYGEQVEIGDSLVNLYGNTDIYIGGSGEDNFEIARKTLQERYGIKLADKGLKTVELIYVKYQ